jgi:hypothetical protein
MEVRLDHVDQDDYAFYRDHLTEACGRFGCAIHAYVLINGVRLD